jgi:hypothetical protein
MKPVTLLDDYVRFHYVVVPVPSIVPVITLPTWTVATFAPTVRAPAVMAMATTMAMATPSPPSAEDAGDEKPEQDQLEEFATGQADKERGDTIKEDGDTIEVPAYEFHHDP